MNRININEKDSLKESKKGRNGIKAIVVLVCVTIIVVVLGAVFFTMRSSGNDSTKITNAVVEEKLSAIAELATYQMEYKDIKTETNIRRFFDLFDIPGTTNSIIITYHGVIKVGYQFSEINPEVDELTKTITVKLPPAMVLSNEIDEDRMEFIENNNLLNPIKCKALTDYIQEIKAEELARAEEQGIYELAEQNAKDLIRDELAEFEGYTIVF